MTDLRDYHRRKPARRRAEVPDDVRRLLNEGQLAAKNLVEGLVIDLAVLAQHVGLDAGEKPKGIVRQMEYYGARIPDWRKYAEHPSDTVRGWAVYAMVRQVPSFAKAVTEVRRFAADAHYGVREWAWMALRPRVAAELDDALLRFAKWTSAKEPTVRRFATEVTRPRGVWCQHLVELKKKPSRGQPILEPLRADDAKYVQDSVANWINDASKDDPAWVQKLLARWTRESKTPATARIVKRAGRGLQKP